MINNGSLTGRVAIVTHGASELGAALCAALGSAGALVVAGAEPDGESQTEGNTTAAALGRIDDLIASAVSRHGRLDLMVNAHVLPPGAPAEDMSLQMFTHGISDNLSATFFGCQSAAGQMLRQTPAGGVIVNLSSTAAVVALPGQAAFCSAMAGVNALTKILATEWGPLGIRVVGLGVGPSAVWSGALAVHPVLPGGERRSHRRLPSRYLTPVEDVAGALVYLAGDEAQHITGTTLYVDGGWLADGYWE